MKKLLVALGLITALSSSPFLASISFRVLTGEKGDTGVQVKTLASKGRDKVNGDNLNLTSDQITACAYKKRK